MAKKTRTVQVKTRLGTFRCLFAPNAPEPGYTVIVPKLRGVVTFGKNLIETKAMAREAIELHCECLLDEGLAEIKVLSRKPKLRSLARA